MQTQEILHKLSVTELPGNTKFENLALHPVQRMQNEYPSKLRNSELLNRANIYGSHSSMKYLIEAHSLSKVRRLPGLKSSHLGMEILDNRLSKLDFEDYMRMDDPFKKEVDVHTLIYEDRI